MKSFRKLPVVIQAGRWFGFTSANNQVEGVEIAPLPIFPVRPEQGNMACDHCHSLFEVHGWVGTLEGGHVVCPGDWIVRGIKGEFYPCKPDIFARTYEEVPSAA